ncbi:conjugative transposon protein TraN [Flavisolibacter nicotianae]|uniref:conjugative transposon protein TraN n=1 Tax=Flavisolibacter nicotianae TaxID=2364882 RepID=UPI000EB38FC1|nr:conjugative transposon protein TraN [Flavisolibacter nicotianae]
MKQLVCLVCALGLVGLSFGQLPSIGLSTAKTSSLVFPLPVRHVDRGSPAILVEQVSSSENILLLKAAKSDFPETNLSVVTDDGSLYTFTVCFDPDPTILTLRLPLQTGGSPAAYAAMILDNPPLLHHTGKEEGEIRAAVAGVYVKDDVLFCQLSLANNSSLDYAVDYLRFAICDQKKVKRTAVQERELVPLEIAGNVTVAKAGSRTSIVAALSRFTIPEQQFLAIEIGEKNGGRNFRLRLTNKAITRAVILPDLR